MQWLIPTRHLRFKGSADWERFREVLRDNERSTKLVPLAGSASAMLSRGTGLTVDGYRYNAAAFFQMAGLLAGGLSPALQSLMQEPHVSPADRARACLSIFNAAVSLCDSKLARLSFVLEKDTGEIVGVVGRKYRFVSNWSLVKALDSRFREAKGSHKFLEGYIRNRDLFVLVGVPEYRLRVSGVDFQQGLAIFNSETTRHAVYVPQAIFDSVSKAYSLERESSDNRLIHRKVKNFGQTLEFILSKSFSHSSILPDLLYAIPRAMSTKFELREPKSLAYSRFKNKLMGEGLSSTISEKLISELLAGRDRRVTSDGFVTNWSFYCVLCRAGLRYPGSARILQSLAFKVLRLEKVNGS